MTHRRYLVTIRINPEDPSRTQDVSVAAESAYQAGWLCKQLRPGARLQGIRLAPEHRQ
jgi:hypothetical protein